MHLQMYLKAKAYLSQYYWAVGSVFIQFFALQCSSVPIFLLLANHFVHMLQYLFECSQGLETLLE